MKSSLHEAGRENSLIGRPRAVHDEWSQADPFKGTINIAHFCRRYFALCLFLVVMIIE